MDCGDGCPTNMTREEDRERLRRTMPMSFQYAFGKQVTIIIVCFEVFIERPTNLLSS